MIPPAESSRFRLQSREALRRSRLAHQAALLFTAASDPKHGGYPGSGAMQAIYVSLAYRRGLERGQYDATLVEMATRLRGDRTKLDNIINLGHIRHGQAGVTPSPEWVRKTPGIIRDVFLLAQDLLVVPEADLLPYYSRYSSILEDVRKQPQDRNDVEVGVRNELRKLAIDHQTASV